MSVTQSCLTLQPHGLWPASRLCPGDSPGKNAGVGSHSLLQGIIPTQESNPGLLYCGQILTTAPTGKSRSIHQDTQTRCPLDEWIPSCYEVTPLGPGNVLCSEVNNVNIASSSFLLFRAAWYIFFYRFIFSLFVLFHLKKKSCSKCQLGLAFYVSEI